MANKITIIPLEITEERYREADSNSEGYCVVCREFTRDCDTEPDARRYPCDVCGMRSCFGTEWAMMCGYLLIKDGD